MIIEMPIDLNMIEAIQFCKRIEELETCDNYIYDYKYSSTFEPFGMLLVGAKVRQFYNRNKDAEHVDINFQGKSYAAHMGFFQSVYQDFGNKPGQASGSNTYVPITKIDLKVLRKHSVTSSEAIQQTIENEAVKLASILSRGNKKLNSTLTYSLRELMRNVEEHSNSDNIWVAGQYWPSKDTVEIAILDEGIGIKRSLASNSNIVVKGDKDALLLAIEPGITRTFTKRKRRNDYDFWANSGYGLYITSSICKNGGSFVICSGSKALVINDKLNKTYDTMFEGTAIRMRIKVSRICELSIMLKDLIAEGEKKAKLNSQNAVITASKVSSLLMNDYK